MHPWSPGAPPGAKETDPRQLLLSDIVFALPHSQVLPQTSKRTQARNMLLRTECDRRHELSLGVTPQTFIIGQYTSVSICTASKRQR